MSESCHTPNAYHYLFGPVPSRRLGRSLGVDLVPFKTCTMNCIYCQLGKTTCEVNRRKDYVPMKDVLSELDRWMKADGRADHITLAGSGEPTLHLHFGDVFRWVREHADIASVLLTNGSLLHDPAVRADAALADKVKVTLSAWNEASFRQIHRPAQGVTFARLLEGERAFREDYAGELSVEVFLVEGVNARVSDVRKIAELVETIRPDRIDLNTAVRPPAESNVKAASEEHLQALAGLFSPRAAVTAAFRKQGSEAGELGEEALLNLIRRHPATCAQLAREFNLPEARMSETLQRMAASGILRSEKRDNETYYLHRIS